MKEAQCPECEGWFEIEWVSDLPPGGWWWKTSGCCPGCGKPVLVESECEFRTVRACAECGGLEPFDRCGACRGTGKDIQPEGS